MSRLSELLKSQAPPAISANSANPDNTSTPISNISNISKGVTQSLNFEGRYRAMCQRWQYTESETLEGLEAARLDPAKAWLTVLVDEQRTDADRAQWMNA